MKKAQISIEFIFAFGIILLMFLIMLGFVVDKRHEISESETQLNKENTCLLISSLITSAFIDGDSTIINVSIDYNITINTTNNNTNDKTLDVEGIYCFLPIKDIPKVALTKGTIKIENQDNYIDIKNV